MCKKFFPWQSSPQFFTLMNNFRKPRIWTKFELLFDLLHFCPNQQVDVKSGGIKHQVKNKNYTDISALGMAGKTRSLSFNQFFFLGWQEMMRKICIWRHKTQKWNYIHHLKQGLVRPDYWCPERRKCICWIVFIYIVYTFCGTYPELPKKYNTVASHKS